MWFDKNPAYIAESMQDVQQERVSSKASFFTSVWYGPFRNRASLRLGSGKLPDTNGAPLVSRHQEPVIPAEA